MAKAQSPVSEKPTVNDALTAAMKRREAKLAAAAEAQAKAAKAKPEHKAKPVAQDHKAPVIGAKQVMAGFESAMAIVRERRLQALARRHPEIAKLLEAAKPAAPEPEPAKSPVIPAEGPDKPAV